MPRVIVVSNRLPVTLHPDRQAPEDVEQSSGGLVSAMRSVVEDFEEVVWIGWPGSFVEGATEQRRLADRLKEASTSIRLVPVWLTKLDVEEFYSGFSNSTLWPLLHWMTPYARFKRTWTETYRRVNQRFADIVLEVCRPGDLIWVHDYHLLLLPAMLRAGWVGPDAAQEVSKKSLTRPKDLPPPLAESSGDAMTDSSEDLSDMRPDYLPVGSMRQGEQSPILRTDSGSRFKSIDLDSPSKLQCSPLGVERSDSVKSGRFKSIELDRHDFQLASPWASSSTSPNKSVRFSVTESVQAAQEAADGDQGLRIAFFLHTPFPSYEIICLLPNSADIIQGMLGADVLGFHTYNYLRHYRSCLTRLCGIAPEMHHIDHEGMRTKLGVYPIGANWQDICEAMKSKEFAEHLQTYTGQFEGKSLVLSVERLDYSKGIPEKLAAIESYLAEADRAKKAATNSPATAAEEESLSEPQRMRSDRLGELQRRYSDRQAEAKGRSFFKMRTSVKDWIGNIMTSGKSEDALDHTKTVFVFIAIPSRQNVLEYQNIEEEVHRMVSTINGRFSTVNHQPIVYIHRGVSQAELAALYARADCCLVTPLVDGMNLVAKEFVASKDRSVENVVPGTLVLSEWAGAAQELFDALVVNPYDEDAVSDAIHQGLELMRGNVMSEDMRWEVTARMRRDVLENDAQAWARRLLQDLQNARRPCAAPRAAGELPVSEARRFFRDARGTKALFLDFDRALQDPERGLQDAPEDVLQGLEGRSDLKVFIIGGLKQERMDECFGALEAFTLVAESGAVMREAGGQWQAVAAESCMDSSAWMEQVQPIMDLFTRCTPGSRLETTALSMVWNYGACDPEYGLFKARDLMHLLSQSIGNLPCEARHADKRVEVASIEARKGVAVRTFCMVQQRAHEKFSEVLCISDDDQDESMLSLAPPGSITVKVGGGDTRASHRVADVEKVFDFLRCVLAGPGWAEPLLKPQDSQVFKSVDERDASAGDDTTEGDPLAWLQEQELEEDA